jgi:hypothetical protein
MRRGDERIARVLFGEGKAQLLLRVEPRVPGGLEGAAWEIRLEGARYRREGRIVREAREESGWAPRPTSATCREGDALEIGIPTEELGAAGGKVEFFVLITQGGAEAERHPDVGSLVVELS